MRLKLHVDMGNHQPSSDLISLVHLPQWCVEQPPLGIAYLTGYLE